MTARCRKLKFEVEGEGHHRGGCSRWPLAGVLTLTDTERSLGLATAGGVKVSYTGYSGRKLRAN